MKLRPKNNELAKANPTTKKRLCVVDTETNPFEPPVRNDKGVLIGVKIKPFTLGFYDGDVYWDFWGDDCVDQFFAHLKSYDEELLIYAHNGGGFDFFFFMNYVDRDQDAVIIRGRLTKMWFQGQEFRDSYKIIPASLASYQKEHIDYANFVPEKREQFKSEILLYQRSDCLYLFDLVEAYQRTFGDALTIGGTSIKVLSKFHPWKQLTKKQDTSLRPYYFGGRNQCFKVGVIRGTFFVYDVNSMYPYVMSFFRHPVGNKFTIAHTVDDMTAFVYFEGWNDGALPTRKDDGGLTFLTKYGKFFCTVHEYLAGIECGLIRVKKLLHTVQCDKFLAFKEFIDYFYDLRLSAKELQDIIYDLFYKLLMNNSYGKFAQDPSTYKDYAFTLGEPPEGELWSDNNPDGWRVHTSFDIGDYIVTVWDRPAKDAMGGYKNVGTAASITGGSRSVLLRGIANATDPIYCDTDSIICSKLDMELNDTNLGGWKLEAKLDVIIVAGKKLYVGLTRDYGYALKILKGNEPEVVMLDGLKHYAIKKASKGVNLSANEILSIARGGSVEYANPVPKFKMDGEQDYIARKIKATALIDFSSQYDIDE